MRVDERKHHRTGLARAELARRPVHALPDTYFPRGRRRDHWQGEHLQRGLHIQAHDHVHLGRWRVLRCLQQPIQP